jgi:NAD-dependent DNA ligase
MLKELRKNLVIFPERKGYEMVNRIYTSKLEANKAFNHLCGIIEGISVDSVINLQEVYELDQWLEKHEDLGRREPFKNLIANVRNATLDGELDQEELEDIKWVLHNLKEHKYFQSYDDLTGDLQRLQGLCHGVLADGVITEDEIRGVAEWVGDHGHLSGLFPYDELVSVLTDILSDGLIDGDEKNYLSAFFHDFVQLRDNDISEAVANRIKDVKRGGVCAIDPEITVSGNRFVITGESSQSSRQEFIISVERFGGIVTTAVSGKTNFLIVGDEGNECWTYACYGRKIEKAMQLRKEGKEVIIVHENDFWDWVADTDARN